jgi:hypothetical protein
MSRKNNDVLNIITDSSNILLILFNLFTEFIINIFIDIKNETLNIP